VSARPAFRDVLENESSNAKGNDLLVLLVIAAHAYTDGTGAYPSVDTIAKQAKVSRSTVKRAIRRLAHAGDLIINERAGAKGAHAYVVTAALPEVEAEPVPDDEPTQVNPPRSTQVTPPGFSYVNPRQDLDNRPGSFAGALGFISTPPPALPGEPRAIHTDRAIPKQSPELDILGSGEGEQHEEPAQDPTVAEWLERLGVPADHPQATALVERFGREQAAWGLLFASGLPEPPDGLRAVRAATTYLTECAKGDAPRAGRLAEAAAKEAEVAA
jgi:hypothetical protein